MLKPFPSVPCLRPAEMGKSAEQMYRQLPCLSAHAMELWVHIIRLLRNQKAPTRRGGRKRNRHSLELSKSHELSDADYIAIEVQAFLSDCLPSFSELFATRNVQVCEKSFTENGTKACEVHDGCFFLFCVASKQKTFHNETLGDRNEKKLKL